MIPAAQRSLLSISWGLASAALGAGALGSLATAISPGPFGWGASPGELLAVYRSLVAPTFAALPGQLPPWAQDYLVFGLAAVTAIWLEAYRQRGTRPPGGVLLGGLVAVVAWPLFVITVWPIVLGTLVFFAVKSWTEQDMRGAWRDPAVRVALFASAWLVLVALGCTAVLGWDGGAPHTVAMGLAGDPTAPGR